MMLGMVMMNTVSESKVEFEQNHQTGTVYLLIDSYYWCSFLHFRRGVSFADGKASTPF